MKRAREKIGDERRGEEEKKSLFIQLVMTGIRDVACIDLAYICSSGVSQEVLRHIFQLVRCERGKKRERRSAFLFLPRCH